MFTDWSALLAAGVAMVRRSAVLAGLVDADAKLAHEYGHLTARQAGRIAHESGVRTLVLTHFSQRYESDDSNALLAEAAASFSGNVVLARDLDRIPGPPRTGCAMWWVPGGAASAPPGTRLSARRQPTVNANTCSAAEPPTRPGLTFGSTTAATGDVEFSAIDCSYA